MALVTVGTTELDKYMAGLDVEWADISSENTARNAVGDLRYLPINNKYKLVITTISMTQTQMTAFFAVIPMTSLSVTYYNPYTGAERTTNMYRGDRKVSFHWDRTDVGKLYKPFTISLIEM